MKNSKLKSFICVAAALAMVTAFSPAAFADSASDDGSAQPVDGSAVTTPDSDTDTGDGGDVVDPAKYVTPGSLVGTTFKKGKITYKITKLSYAAADKGTATVALYKYAGGTTAKIPTTVTHYTKYSIDDLSGTASFKVKYKVTSVAANAFNNSKGHKIKKLVIGANVVSIGAKAFYKCKKLTKITYKGKALGNAAKFTSKGKLKKSPIGKEAFAGVPRSCKTQTPSSTDWKHLQYKQGVRASMTYGGYKGIVY